MLNLDRNLPNIVFLVLDTQRADRLSCYQAHPDPDRPPITPNLDHFATQSTLFERAISPAQWTIPAHASMFTGEYPSTHQVVQADLELDPSYPTLAELLRIHGYQTIGFCNNPLVGVLKNGLRRGFDIFYNYGGALPTRPASGTPLPPPLNWILEQYTQFWRKLSYPVQNAFAKSDRLFQLALHPWFTSVWSRLFNFKGHTPDSIRDVSRFLIQAAQDQSRLDQSEVKPFFCFVNLMEPHLPYWPPEPFIQKFAPYFSQDRSARDFLRQYNSQPYRWMAPLKDPLTPIEAQVLSDIYDAEVAYQDHLLGQVFSTLSSTGLLNNTMVVIVADHGEGLGEHEFVGHAFVVYEELVRVPLIVHYPEIFPAGARIKTPVSTRRLFHTVLDLVGLARSQADQVEKGILRKPQLSRQVRREINRLSLRRTVTGVDPEHETVLAEAFPPHILIRAMEKRADQLLQERACHSTRRALYRGENKLVQIGEEISFFDLNSDPQELQDQLRQLQESLAEDPAHASHSIQEEVQYLQHLLQHLIATAESRRSTPQTTQKSVDLETNADLIRRMQELGYMD